MGRSSKRIFILTVYQVPQKTGSSGSTTAYTQQSNMFRLEGRQNPNPRKILIDDLRQLASEIRRDGHDMILMGDFNEDIGLDHHGMASVITAGGLVDSYRTCHGLQNEPSTYARGKSELTISSSQNVLLPSL